MNISTSKNGFFILPNDYLYDEKLSVTDKELLCVIASFGQDCTIRPSISYFVNLLGVSEKTIIKSLKHLEKLGYLSITRRGLWKTNIYKLIDFKKHQDKCGFVFVPKDIFVKNNGIHIISKLIYCGFCVLSGVDNVFKKTLSAILNVLKINKNTFYKYRDALISANLITCEKEGNTNKYKILNKKSLKNENKKKTESKDKFVHPTNSVRRSASYGLQSNKNILNNILLNNILSNKYNISIRGKKSSIDIKEILNKLNKLYKTNKDYIFRNTIKNLKIMLKTKKQLVFGQEKITSEELVKCLKNNDISLIKLINRVSENIKAEIFEKNLKGEIIKYPMAYYFSTIWNEIKEMINDKETMSLSDFSELSYSKKIAQVSYELNEFYSKNNRLPNEKERNIITCKAYINKFFKSFVSSYKENAYFKDCEDQKDLYKTELIVSFAQSSCDVWEQIQLLFKAFTEIDSTFSYSELIDAIMPQYGELSKLEIAMANDFLEPMHEELKEIDIFFSFKKYLREKFNSISFSVRNLNNFFDFFTGQVV